MIIAVDFDGTLEIKGKPNHELIQNLIIAQRKGNIVILWTCRQGKSLMDAVRFLNKEGFSPNLINENAPEAIRMLRGNPRKIYADIYIDDKGKSI